MLCGVNSLRASPHAFGDIVKSTLASGDATAMGGQRKMKLLFTASCSPPLGRSRVLAWLASLVQMESLPAGFGVKPVLNTELN